MLANVAIPANRRVTNRLLGVLGILFFSSLGFGQTILQVAADDPSLSTFVEALERAGLADTLNSEGPFTLFAPTDAAFSVLPEAELTALLNDESALREVMTYHIIPAYVLARDAVQATSAPTLEGDRLRLQVRSGRLYINDATVIKFDVGASEDVQASNGVIHVVDSVLLPEEIDLEALTASAPAPAGARAAPLYSTEAARSVRNPLSVVGNSGIGGSVLIADYGFDETVLTVAVRGTLRDVQDGVRGGYPAQLRMGDCGSGGEDVGENGISLSDVNAATGLSVTTLDAPYDALVDDDYALELLSADDPARVVACGEVGSGAN